MAKSELEQFIEEAVQLANVLEGTSVPAERQALLAEIAFLSGDEVRQELVKEFGDSAEADKVMLELRDLWNTAETAAAPSSWAPHASASPIPASIHNRRGHARAAIAVPKARGTGGGNMRLAASGGENSLSGPREAGSFENVQEFATLLVDGEKIVLLDDGLTVYAEFSKGAPAVLRLDEKEFVLESQEEMSHRFIVRGLAPRAAADFALNYEHNAARHSVTWG